MGTFDTTCAATGIGLIGDVCAIVLVRDGGWKPLTAPIAGRYDEYRAVEDVDEKTR